MKQPYVVAAFVFLLGILAIWGFHAFTNNDIATAILYLAAVITYFSRNEMKSNINDDDSAYLIFGTC